MSSDIQKLADNLRALAKDKSGVASAANKAAVEAGKLAELALAAGSAGVATGALAAQFDAAARKARTAKGQIESVQKKGSAYADHLAAKSGGGVHPVTGVAAVATGIAFGALVGTTTMDGTLAYSDLQSGKDPGQTLQEFRADKLENDDNLADVAKSLRESDDYADRVRNRKLDPK